MGRRKREVLGQREERGLGGRVPLLFQRPILPHEKRKKKSDYVQERGRKEVTRY